MRRNIKTSSSATKERAYKALVRPIVEYGSTVWDPKQKDLKDAVEKVQRRAARYVTNNYARRASVTKMLEELNWETLEQRRLKARVTMGFKIIHGLVAIPSVQFVPKSVNTRGSQLSFRHLDTRTDYYKYTFFPSVIILWNSLPKPIVQASDLDQFKRRLATIQLDTFRR